MTSLLILVGLIVSFPFIEPSVISRSSDVTKTDHCANLYDEVGNPYIHSPIMETLLLFPAMAFAFSFECSVLPIHDASRKKDPTGIRSFRACIICLFIVLAFYTILMIHSMIYGELISHEYDLS